jgi:hypothetical protein
MNATWYDNEPQRLREHRERQMNVLPMNATWYDNEPQRLREHRERQERI